MSIDNQEIKKAGLKAGLWNFSTTFINQIRNFIVSLVLARLLEPSDFGLVAMATASINIFESFVDVGFGESIIQKKGVTNVQLSSVFYINLFLGLVMSVIILFTSGMMSNFLNEPQLSIILKVISISFIIKGIQSLPSALLRKNLQYKSIFNINLISGIVSGAIGIIMAFNGFGIWALIGSQVSNWLVSTVLIWIYVRWYPSIVFRIKAIRSLWSFGYKLLLTTIIDSLFFNINPILIGKIFNPSELGLYNRAQSLNILVGRYSYSAFASVLLPTLSKYQDDLNLLRYNFKKIINVVCFTTFLLSGIMICSSSPLITFLYGEKWEGAVRFFQILGFFTITGSLNNVMYYTLLSVGRSDVTLRIQFIEKILIIIAICIGVFNSIYIYVVSVCIATFISTFIYSYHMKVIRYSVGDFLKSFSLYSFPFIILSIIGLMFNIYNITNYKILNILISSGYFAFPYILYNIFRETEGYNSFLNLIKSMAISRR